MSRLTRQIVVALALRERQLDLIAVPASGEQPAATQLPLAIRLTNLLKSLTRWCVGVSKGNRCP